MNSIVLKWRYRGGLKAASNWKYRTSLKNLYNKIGFKFKKLNDYISVKSKYYELKDTEIDIKNLKLNTITMKDGLCFFCSDGIYNDKTVERVEHYAYTAYIKGMRALPNLFNLF
jgi:hypothetical protein